MNTQNLTKTIEVRGHTEAKSYHVSHIYTKPNRNQRKYFYHF
jgi:hypothetical protein